MLDPIFNPLLQLDVLWIVFIISLVVSLIIIVIYKYTTNQDLMKQLKEEIKAFQKETKELKAHPEKMMEVQKKAMKTNMKYMTHSMRSTLYTFIPIILIFGWMNANIAYEPIYPDQEFNVTAIFGKGTIGDIELIAPTGVEVLGNSTQEIKDNEASWILKGSEGDYINENALEFEFEGQTRYKDLIITNEQKYAKTKEKIKNSGLKIVQIENKPMKILNLFGWKIGWLGTYIIFSLVFSILLRKIFKVY